MITAISRALYVTAVVALVGGTGWAASGMKSESRSSAGGVGIVLLAALQR